MKFPSGYPVALSIPNIQRYFPNLQEKTNFEFTSLRDPNYNCVAWASEITETWEQCYDEHGDVLESAERYIQYFKDRGFTESASMDLENEVQKIAIYLDTATNKFRHVARQLKNGKWTSKLGDWEDIQHDKPENLLGNLYGDKVVIFEKR